MLVEIIGGFLLTVWAFFVMKVMAIELSKDSRRFTWCVASQRDYRTGLLQYSKLVLELSSVAVYALGPQRDPMLGRLRCTTLPMMILLSWTIFGMYKPSGHSMMIPRLQDQQIAGKYCEIMHTNIVSSMGLFEVLRPDCPSISYPENNE